MKTGDILSTTTYLEVLKTGQDKEGNDAIWAKNLETGEELGVTLNVAGGFFHANEFTETEKVSMTEAVEILENVGDKVFEVEFSKKPGPVKVFEAMQALPAKKQTSKTAMERCMLGESRVMRGRLKSIEAKLGRSQVIDLSITKDLKATDRDNRARLVDHRTIKSLTVGGTKYVVK